MNRNMAAMLWAHEARGVSPTAYRVLVCLAQRVNSKRQDYDVWPSQKKLAARAEISVPTLRRHLDELEAKGFLEREQLTRDNGAKSVCRYRLNVVLTVTQPDGQSSSYDDDDGDEEDAKGMEKSDGRGIERRLSMACNTAFPCNEPLKERTTEREEESPLPPEGESEGGNLFGQSPAPIAIPDQAFGDLYVDMWNQLASRVPALKAVKPLRDENLKALMARLRENKAAKSLDAARDLLGSQLAQFEGSRLLRGEGDRGWVPAATWLLGKKNFGKVIDGNYIQDAAAGADRPKRRDERSYVDTANAVGDILRARGPAPRKTARELAGIAPGRSPRDYL